ncbi:Predicted dehydrogenase [Trichococcus flocculiformis]|uniref:Gfo/Idh/MocA family protein n=1 Tax=Trichococcus TaxID=82802 RepID=UPI0007A80B63|nr:MULTISPECIES: Gfo/Idh/MocA family oxidoreductase [Trichococcus]CZR10744.1 Hypothetical protein TES5_2925 [Trichococcus sp. ES5]SHG24764.1 Predicted dehydrogenase [Trichococcus flocculiformis]
MKIAVIGLGSMGKRRIRLMQGSFPEIELVGIDGRADRQSEVEEIYNISCFSSLTEAWTSDLNGVVISTSPLSHEAIIKEALHLNVHVFTEINLLNHYYDEVMALANEKKLHLYLSSTFLHRKEIAYMAERIMEDQKVTYRYHVGQYLADWHPWESYKDFFVSHKETNGCREIFAIELPWLTTVFGDIVSAEVNHSKISNLEIDYPDTYSVLLKHESGITGTLNVNIVSRIAKRELEIIGESTQIEWRGTPDSLEEWSHEAKQMQAVSLYDTFEHQEGYAKNIIEDAYLEEIKEYIALLRGDIQDTKYSFEQDKKVIDWIHTFEEGI